MPTAVRGVKMFSMSQLMKLMRPRVMLVMMVIMMPLVYQGRCMLMKMKLMLVLISSVLIEA